MFSSFMLIVLLFRGVLSDGPDGCVRYDFEDFDNVFPRDVPDLCENRPWLWNQGSYDNSTIAAPNEKSKWFIQAPPSTAVSCTASFLFTIVPGGIAETKVYSETISGTNVILNFRLFQLTDTGDHRLLGLRNIALDFTGWQVLTATDLYEFMGNPPYQGYVQFLGLVQQSSNIMILDSFRYVPPSMDPEIECIMYEDTITVTTLAPTETPTPTPIFPTSTITTILTTPTTTPTDPATTPETTPTTTPTTPIITPPNNLTNYFFKELVDFRKSVRISKKRITKVGNIYKNNPLKD